MLRALTILLLLAFSSLVVAGEGRSTKQRRAFVAANPCPATGLSYGSCPGYVVDHIEPLCAGGPDRPVNMRWQTIEAAKIKDRDERRLCMSLRRR